MTEQKYYPEVKSNVNFPEIENEILKYWKENNIFQKSIDNRDYVDSMVDNGDAESVYRNFLKHINFIIIIDFRNEYYPREVRIIDQPSANNRIHGTTRKKPRDLFEAEEKLAKQ